MDSMNKNKTNRNENMHANVILAYGNGDVKKSEINEKKIKRIHALILASKKN